MFILENIDCFNKTNKGYNNHKNNDNNNNTNNNNENEKKPHKQNNFVKLVTNQKTIRADSTLISSLDNSDAT